MASGRLAPGTGHDVPAHPSENWRGGKFARGDRFDGDPDDGIADHEHAFAHHILLDHGTVCHGIVAAGEPVADPGPFVCHGHLRGRRGASGSSFASKGAARSRSPSRARKTRRQAHTNISRREDCYFLEGADLVMTGRSRPRRPLRMSASISLGPRRHAAARIPESSGRISRAEAARRPWRAPGGEIRREDRGHGAEPSRRLPVRAARSKWLKTTGWTASTTTSRNGTRRACITRRFFRKHQDPGQLFRYAMV